MLKTLVAAIQAWATSLGGPGLFVIAALDSSFLSFPQVNDLLIIVLSTKSPALMPYYAAMTTAGSLARLLHALRLCAERRRGVPAPARERPAPRTRPGALPAPRLAGGGRPVAPAAADAVQGVRAARRRGGCFAVEVCRRDHRRARNSLLRPGVSGRPVRRTGVRDRRAERRHGRARPRRSRVAGALAYYVVRKRRTS